MLNEVKEQTERALRELIEVSNLDEGDIVVVGCSSSEVMSEKIGTGSSQEIGQAIFETAQAILAEHNLNMAAQCCEHLNRSLVIEKSVAKVERYPIVNAVPHVKAGGSFATAAYAGMKQPVLVESVGAKAGIDIGQTFIGMHMVPVVVPVRLAVKKIGGAILSAARTRPRSIGGERAQYDDRLK
ncbi:TIGR01440 family protein [Jeotgalibaca caeni]|uniref:TIGR01440 family protein n=1 Tax=Jeotgalibaca caeni TaxID=3028623 RepID=UPI00237D8B7A|nr:TIGR01440 family protein [Jeotgalibaca caeni]MDE1548672.1 TIGR01440 family protein [Jeotgalibaca caeni]